MSLRTLPVFLPKKLFPHFVKKKFQFYFIRNLSVASEQADEKSSNMVRTRFSHRPVLAKEILEFLNPQDGQTFIDLTFGAGGHTKRLFSSGKKIKVYGLDRDPLAHQEAVVLAKKIQELNQGQELVPLLGRFSELSVLFKKFGLEEETFDGAILDLGASSMQFDNPKRGFALSKDGPLDMRMDGERFLDMPTAADVINTLSSDYLAKIFKVYGEERRGKKIAQVIVDARFMMKRLSSTTELAQLINNITDPASLSHDKLGRPVHAGTKVFQALRIFVNNEMNELNYCLEKISKYMKRSTKIDPFDRHKEINPQDVDGGRIAVLSFHSLEDKIVKQHLVSSDLSEHDKHFLSQRQFSFLETSSKEDIIKMMRMKWRQINKHVILPTEEEILYNPRCRSAKLRLAVRV